MAEKQQKWSGYDYKSIAHLVVQTKDRVKDESAGVTGESESLRGRQLAKFGDRAAHSRPKELEEKLKKSQEKREKRDRTAAKEKLKTFGGADILAASEDMEAVYRPKTRETRAAYELLLNFIRGKLGDQPQDILRGAAEEVLTSLKNEHITDPQRKVEIESLLKTISPEDLNTLVNIGKRITDYSADEISLPAGSAMEDEEGLPLVIEEEDEDEDDLDEVRDEGADNDEEVGAEDTEMSTSIYAEHLPDEDVKSHEERDEIAPRSIDAYWLQREFSKIFRDELVCQSKTEEALEILAHPDGHEAESNLVALLDYEHEHFPLAKKLLRNRRQIVFCTRLARSKSDKERESIEAEMEEDSDLRRILHILRGVSVSSEEEGRRDAASSKAAGKRSAERQDSASASGKKTLNLDELKFEQGGHFMSNRKCDLPEGSQRISKKGYEEIHIPAPKARPMADGERLVPISDLPAWAQPAFAGMKTLNRMQSRLYKSALFSAENLLLCAPTGAGKTNVAMLSMLQAIGNHLRDDGSIDLENFKIVYVAPMKALVQEVVTNFAKRLEPFGMTVGELTGDMQMTKEQISKTQVIVTTPEKWDIVTRKAGDRTFSQLVRLIIIDEIHLLHDERGSVLESIVARTLRQIESTQEMVRIVGLSATLPNYHDVALFLRVKTATGLFHFDSSFRPCPLEQQYIGISAKKALKRFQIMNEIVYEKVIERAGKHQMIVFVHSRKDTVKTARSIREMALEADTLGRFMSEESTSRPILQQEAESCTSNDLKDLLPYGFAMHHAGMNRQDRTLVEDLFAAGHVQVLVSTATLAWGVNLPAHSVIIKGTQVYNPEKGRWTELSPLDIMQMMGRAGRPQFDTYGEGMIITTHQELQYYLSLLNQQLPIESQFISRLPDMLNAEIVLGTVQNAREAATWLGYTYLYVRMLRNPSLYGISAAEAESDKLLDQRRMDLINSAAALLEKSNLVKYDKRSGSFQITDLGRVASYYYVSHTSMDTFNQVMKPTMSDIELFRLFSLSSEFKHMTVREEEKEEVRKLMENVPIPIKESLEESSAKVNVLLQAFISQLRLEGFALMADMVYVTQSAGRIVRALFEIAIRRGWSQVAQKLLSLGKMVEHRMWSTQNPLRQFRGLPDEVIRRLEKKSLSLERLFDLSDAELGELIKLPKLGKKIYRSLHQIPKLELTAHVQPVTRSMLRVELTVTPDFEFDDKVHGASMAFWILVEDGDSEVVLHYEPFILKQRFSGDSHYITFTIPIFEPLPPQYFIRVVSDRWIGFDASLPISFRHLILPEKFPSQTELLDLQPLPISALRASKYESLYRGSFTHFNPVQTQTFNACYGTDDSVLIGAPTGSGKTVCAELAILRMFNENPSGGARCVYVATTADICDISYRNWSQRFGEGLGRRVVRLTGETSVDLKLIERGEIIVATAEQWDILSRRWRQRKNVQAVRLFIVDELHLIGGAQGPTLEIVCSRMRYMSSELESKLRFVALTSSLANAKDLGEWLGASSHSVFNFHPNVRPVPLEIHIQGFDNPTSAARMLAMTKPCYTAIKNQANSKPSLVFVPARKQARLTAVELVTLSLGEENPQHFVHCSQKELDEHLRGVQDAGLKQSLQYGVGYLHEGVRQQDRDIVERLFKAGSIQVLVASNTICWSLNVEAHVVVIMGSQFYDGREHRYVDYPVSDILQMMGRASRPNLDDSGKVFLYCHGPKKEYYKKFLYEPLPVESHLDHLMADLFAAEIVVKTIENKQDAIDYLTWTFFFRRLKQNPNYYNLQGVTSEHLSDFLSELVEKTLADLSAAKCIAMEEDDMSVTPLNLGMISSYYYIRYTSIELFNSSVTASTKLRGLLDILSAAYEFDDIPVRHKEEDALRKMAMHLPLKIENARYTDPHTKTNILLQSQFTRAKLAADLDSDKAHVLEIFPRLIQSMVDVISSNGWLSPALATMELSQMSVQALLNTDSPLLQLSHFTPELARKCQQKGVETIYDLLDMEDADRRQLLQMSERQLADVARDCARYPNIDVTFEVSNADEVAEGEAVEVVVELQREADEDEDDEAPAEVGPVRAPHFPKTKDEIWWLVLGDPKRNQMLAIKKLTLQQSAKVKLDFVAPAAGSYQYMLYFMCDSYMGCDQEFEVPLQVGAGEMEDS